MKRTDYNQSHCICMDQCKIGCYKSIFFSTPYQFIWVVPKSDLLFEVFDFSFTEQVCSWSNLIGGDGETSYF